MWKNGLQNVNGPAFTQFAFYSLEDEKNRFCQPKKWRENRHFGVWFSEGGMEIAKQKPGSEENPSHAWPSPKGDGHRWKRWAVPKPKTSKESGFLFLARKSGIFHALLRRTYLKNRSKIGFSVAFPFWKKEKKEKKRIGLVFNLWETHKGTNVGPAKKWLWEVPLFWNST